MSDSSSVPDQRPGKPESRVGEVCFITDGEVRVYFENFPAILAGKRKVKEAPPDVTKPTPEQLCEPPAEKK